MKLSIEHEFWNIKHHIEKSLCMVRKWLFVISLGLILLAGGCAACVWSVGMLWLRIAMVCFFFLALFCFWGVLLYEVHSYFKRLAWRIIGACVLFAWGCTTFFFFPLAENEADGFMARMLRATNRTSKLMVSKGMIYGKPLSSAGRVNYGLFQTCLIFYLTALASSIWGRKAANQLRIRLTPDSQLNVFWVVTDRSVTLAQSIRKSDDAEFIQCNLPISLQYDKSEMERMTDFVDRIGQHNVCWQFVDFSELGRECHRGKRHFFLGDNGHSNLVLANRVAESFLAAQCQGKALPDIKLYVLAHDVDHELIYVKWAQDVYARSNHHVVPLILKEQDLVAQDYVRRCDFLGSPIVRLRIDPQTAMVGRDELPRTLLLGFDHTGRALLNAHLPLARLVGDDSGSVAVSKTIVIDMDPARWERYRLACPEIGDHCNRYGVDFKSMKVGTEEFENWFRENHAMISRIVFCLPNDDYNVREALRLCDIFADENDTSNKEVLVRVADPDVCQLVDNGPEPGGLENVNGVSIRYFGKRTDLYSIETLDSDPVEKIAKSLNWCWDRGCKGEDAALLAKSDKMREHMLDECWNKASYYDRLSSRASAQGVWSFSRLLGLGLADAQDSVAEAVPLEEVEKKIGPAMATLARVEHLRWCAYEATVGVKAWDLATPRTIKSVVDDREKTGKPFTPNKLANQVETFRRHAALVDFDELPELDARLARACGFRFAKFTAKDFVGDVRTDETGVSLQGKDCDVWKMLPRAVRLAGLKFVSA